jgi:hypothetical protein
LLVIEVVREDSLGAVGLFGDCAHRGVRETVSSDYSPRRMENLVSARLLIYDFRQLSHHRFGLAVRLFHPSSNLGRLAASRFDVFLTVIRAGSARFSV